MTTETIALVKVKKTHDIESIYFTNGRACQRGKAQFQVVRMTFLYLNVGHQTQGVCLKAQTTVHTAETSTTQYSTFTMLEMLYMATDYSMFVLRLSS